MKNKASILLKKITSVLSAIAKAKSMAINTKFSATKARLLMLSMVKSKKILLDSLSHKIHTILGHDDIRDDDDADNHSKAIVLYDAANAHSSQYQASGSVAMAAEVEEEDDKYPDLTHSMFNEEDDYDMDDAKLQAAGGSIIDMMRNSKEEGEEFKLEEEIDEAADLFIKRFRKQIRLQKLESFKRLQEMLARGT
ncbi:DUF761 domain-containing protein [Cucumis melo var. makuwa]|uniref:Uncharacterized protein LOC103502825 n=2 Tax=Cucumis melo TaxID=3656 RepID=A0A1S3CN57_CUCME|nr:uncharacterized protein LOC103502825 [Cucumis melo]KAA0037700.1 DUF761 domain-containing protein [Cucumis melo var. makuwa]TYK27023.1 DUF761 domain-containing protein [Cucumis melo var. makuwa]